MSTPRYDVAGIGNAIVDVLTQTDDAFLEGEGLAKGAMTLVDETQAAQVYDKAGPAMECSGGSAANTIAVMARLGASLPAVQVDSAAAHGLDPQWVEAACFAWLACRRMRGEPGNLPSVTGALRPAVLGGIYAP